MELVLPSSPVWYQTKASDTSCDGFFAFSSRSLIYLLDVHEDVPLYFGVLHGHEERVTTCAFSKKKSCLLASGGDDCMVKVWNIASKATTNENSLPGMGKITALHWSPFFENIILYGDEKGCLVVWNFGKGSTNKYFPDGSHQQITCVVCSLHYQNLVAVGYKSGAVSIVDFQNRGMVIRKFRGHGNEIHSIVWSYLPREDTVNFTKTEIKSEVEGKLSCPTQNQLEGFVVSGSKDRTIRVWSLMKGKGIKILKLPTKPSKGKRASEETARIYVTLHWPEGSESTFLSSSYNGDLLMWNLSKPDKEMSQVLSSQSPDSGHQRVIFNINAGLNPRSDVITTSMDRQIKVWSLSNPKAPPVCSLPTLGGYVYSVETSPIDPSVLALGVGDGAIRLWRTKNPRNPFDITVLWQGVKEKVMSLAWHPEKEGILAFGTEDGKVGLYDILSMKPPTISETYHMKPVYAISWGPQCYPADRGDDIADSLTSWLYTCGGEGVIMMHPPDLKSDGVDVLSIVSASSPGHAPGRRSEVSWRKDGKFVAMGNDNGSFDIYRSPHLRHVVTVKVHSKIINRLRWRPNKPGEEISGWIASGSVNSNVCVTNIETFLDETSQGNEHENLVTEPYRSLVGHASRITGLSWNPNNNHQLVSASYDGTVQVWNVKEGIGLANYRGHDGRTLCVEWSAILEENSPSGLIYSGGDDYSVHVWKMEKQENKLPPKELTNVGFTQKHTSLWKKKNKKKKQNVSQVETGLCDANDDADIAVLLENKKKELIADMKLDSEIDNIDADASNMRNKTSFSSSGRTSLLNPNAEPFPAPPSDEVKEVMLDLSENRAFALETKEDDKALKRRRVKNLFPLSVALDNQKKEHQQLDCIDIVKYKNNKQLLETIPERPNLGLYGDRKSTFRMLNKESEKLEEADNHFGSQSLKIWKADVIGAVESAIERNDLTDHIVALAPMGGHDLWLRACRAFAEQLAREGFYLHAANYLVACNKVADAIILLRENKFYREAVALARTRLHDNHPLLIETVRIWANRLKNGSSHEMAAKCFASINEYQLAADCLSERARSKTLLGEDDLHSVFAAALLARHANLDSCHGYIKHALVDIATYSGRWSHGHSAARKFKDLSYIRLILCVHEMLCLCATSSLEPEKFSLDEFADNLHSSWAKGLVVTGPEFADLLAKTWKTIANEYLSKMNDQAISDIEPLCTQNSYNGLTMKQSLFKASLHIACAYLCVNCYHNEVMKKTFYHHTTSMIADVEDTLKVILEEICQSFIAITTSKLKQLMTDEDSPNNDVDNGLSSCNKVSCDISKLNLNDKKIDVTQFADS